MYSGNFSTGTATSSMKGTGCFLPGMRNSSGTAALRADQIIFCSAGSTISFHLTAQSMAGGTFASFSRTSSSVSPSYSTMRLAATSGGGRALAKCG